MKSLNTEHETNLSYQAMPDKGIIISSSGRDTVIPTYTDRLAGLVPAGGIPGGAALQFQDESIDLGPPTVDTVNFLGAGVTASRSGDIITVYVPGGGDYIGLAAGVAAPVISLAPTVNQTNLALGGIGTYLRTGLETAPIISFSDYRLAMPRAVQTSNTVAGANIFLPAAGAAVSALEFGNTYSRGWRMFLVFGPGPTPGTVPIMGGFICGGGSNYVHTNSAYVGVGRLNGETTWGLLYKPTGTTTPNKIDFGIPVAAESTFALLITKPAGVATGVNVVVREILSNGVSDPVYSGYVDPPFPAGALGSAAWEVGRRHVSAIPTGSTVMCARLIIWADEPASWFF